MPVLQAPAALSDLSRPVELPSVKQGTAILRVLSVSALVFLLHGFHPFREDASIYVAGIERRFDPALFARDTLFVDGHTRLSLFSSLSAALLRATHLPLETLLLVFYASTLIAFVAGCQALATRLFPAERERWGATLLAGICFTLPAAATSLLIMDPYVTARSFTTPLSLFVMAACCDRAWKTAAGLTVVVLLLHPLMGAYLVSFVLLFALIQSGRRRAALLLAATGLVVCGLIAAHDATAAVSPDYRTAALSRTYYFLGNWKWYELAGLLLPLLLLAAAAVRSRSGSLVSQWSLVCLLVGGTATLASVLFVHPSHLGLLTRLQVLRSFHTIYVLGVILFGGYLAGRLSGARIWLGVPLALALAGAMYLGDESPYQHLGHIDWPLAHSQDPWMHALLWIRANTPADAVFAAAPQSLKALQATSTGFRSLTQRSILTDIKDEGVASIFPASSAEWAARRAAQQQLGASPASITAAATTHFGVSWLLLPPGDHAPLSCPFRNAVVSVCRVGRQGTP